MLAIEGGDESKVGWRKLRKEDIRCMEDADDLARKEEKRKKALVRRKRKYQELIDHGENPNPWEDVEDDSGDDDEGSKRPGAGESKREISWIWTAAGSAGTDTNFEDGAHFKFV
jgi:hypothetical protein